MRVHRQIVDEGGSDRLRGYPQARHDPRQVTLGVQDRVSSEDSLGVGEKGTDPWGEIGDGMSLDFGRIAGRWREVEPRQAFPMGRRG